MTQHYIDPYEVIVSDVCLPWETRGYKHHIAKDGLIVPILVTVDGSGKFHPANHEQACRVIACRELEFETILLEDDFTEDDLA